MWVSLYGIREWRGNRPFGVEVEAGVYDVMLVWMHLLAEACTYCFADLNRQKRVAY